VHRAPGIPCALCSFGDAVFQHSGAMRAEIADLRRSRFEMPI
jgi:hypothetical protein